MTAIRRSNRIAVRHLTDDEVHPSGREPYAGKSEKSRAIVRMILPLCEERFELTRK
jgi:hypothetical protein